MLTEISYSKSLFLSNIFLSNACDRLNVITDEIKSFRNPYKKRRLKALMQIYLNYYYVIFFEI